MPCTNCFLSDGGSLWRMYFQLGGKYANKKGKKREREVVGVWERNRGKRWQTWSYDFSYLEVLPVQSRDPFPLFLSESWKLLQLIKLFGSKHGVLKTKREVWLYRRRDLSLLAGIIENCLLVVRVNTICMCQKKIWGCVKFSACWEGVEKNYTNILLYSQPNLNSKLKCKENKPQGEKNPSGVFRVWALGGVSFQSKSLQKLKKNIDRFG